MKNLCSVGILFLTSATFSLLSSSLVLAQSTPAVTKAAAPAATSTLSDGEIKKVLVDSKQLTIQHGPLANLNMPGMTMSFKVKDPAMLQQVKPGDKVRLLVEKVDGALTVTTLQKQP